MNPLAVGKEIPTLVAVLYLKLSPGQATCGLQPWGSCQATVLAFSKAAKVARRAPGVRIGYNAPMRRRFQFSLRAKWLAYVLLVFCAVNWASSIAVTVTLGGVASKVEQGRFFVNNHGDYTEVSESSYQYERLLSYSSLACLPLFWASGYILAREQRRKNGDKRRD